MKKALYDTVSAECSKHITRKYSTSFSLGIHFLDKKLHDPIYAIYGFVRLADEIVDSFHDYDKEYLMEKFRKDTVEAIEQKISLNPVLNAFQEAVHKYNIEWDLTDKFLQSMEMDLDPEREYDRLKFDDYILGSAEVVGLMCLRVFVEGDDENYQKLRPFAMKLGAAFQKVNFLRDAGEDFKELGRTYFPDLDLNSFSMREKLAIEAEIAEDFAIAMEGIRMLPKGARFGVYLAYLYYIKLFKKIRQIPPQLVLSKRTRIPNGRKMGILLNSLVRHQLNML